MQNVFMNKAILLIVSIWLIGMTANAKEMVFPGDSLYEHGGSGSWGGGNKSPRINDLQVSVLDFLGTKLIVVTVQSNLGTVDFTITNQNTGEYLDGELNAQPGSYPIPISGTRGNYSAVFTLSGGRRYEKEFIL